MKILLTGASGFIGSCLLPVLDKKFSGVLALTRKEAAYDPRLQNTRWTKCDLAAAELQQQDLQGVDAVIHLAARAHMLNKSTTDPWPEFWRTNVQATLQLAQQAAQAGARRFIFISSIGVHGTHSVQPFTVNAPLKPAGLYAESKLQAEQGLRDIEKQTGLEVVIIRPPLVYGPGAPGNFARLLHLVQKGVPLPLGLVQNKRSLVAVDNLVDLILTCVEHPNAAGQTFLVSDGEDLSTPELIRKLAWAMGKRPRLLPVPPGLLRLGGTMLGKRQEVEKLIGSLQVDIGHTCETLGWRPPFSVDEGLAEVGRNWTANCANLRPG